MNILLFGVSNVGKSTTGSILASRLRYSFYDLDVEIKKTLGITLEEFVNSGTLQERDQIRCSIITSLVCLPDNKVIAVTPLSYTSCIQHLFSAKDVFPIVLTDSAENIFERLVFSDRNDNIYKDDEYKTKHKKYFLSEIRKDLQWYGYVYSSIPYRFDMNGKDTAHVVETLIQNYHLDSLMGE